MTFPPPRHLYGEELTTSSDEIKVVANPSTKQSVPPIEIDRWCRNGQHPHVTFQNLLNQQANAAVLYRSKQVFSFGDTISSIPADPSIASFGVGDRARWRFAFRTGPYTHALYCVVVMRPQTSGYTTNSYGRLDIATNTAGTPAVASQTFGYGVDPSNGTGALNTWTGFRVIMNFIDGISPDTEYYGTFYDVDYGRILSACVFDLQSLTEHNDGYLGQGKTTHSPVLTQDRLNVVSISNALWQKGGSHVWNFSVNDGTAPLSIGSTTATNIIDQTSTAISAATPGATLDMRNKDRISQTSGVPCVMKMFAKTSAASTGSVLLKDSAGSTIATCTTTSTTAAWTSVSFNLPATVDKYDLQFKNSVGAGKTTELYAVSIWEQG
jgi:hypothetical protein